MSEDWVEEEPSDEWIEEPSQELEPSEEWMSWPKKKPVEPEMWMKKPLEEPSQELEPKPSEGMTHLTKKPHEKDLLQEWYNEHMDSSSDLSDEHEEFSGLFEASYCESQIDYYQILLRDAHIQAFFNGGVNLAMQILTDERFSLANRPKVVQDLLRAGVNSLFLGAFLKDTPSCCDAIERIRSRRYVIDPFRSSEPDVIAFQRFVASFERKFSCFKGDFSWWDISLVESAWEMMDAGEKSMWSKKDHFSGKLVIGIFNWSYESGKDLPGVRADFLKFIQVFDARQSLVTTMVNASRREIIEFLDEIQTWARAVQPYLKEVLVVFSGHGTQRGDETPGICGVDQELITQERIIEILERSPILRKSHITFQFDSCRGGSLPVLSDRGHRTTVLSTLSGQAADDTVSFTRTWLGSLTESNRTISLLQHFETAALRMHGRSGQTVEIRSSFHARPEKLLVKSESRKRAAIELKRESTSIRKCSKKVVRNPCIHCGTESTLVCKICRAPVCSKPCLEYEHYGQCVLDHKIFIVPVFLSLWDASQRGYKMYETRMSVRRTHRMSRLMQSIAKWSRRPLNELVFQVDGSPLNVEVFIRRSSLDIRKYLRTRASKR